MRLHIESPHSLKIIMCEIIRLKEAFSLYITYCNRGRLHIQTMHLRIVVVVRTYVKYILWTMHKHTCTLNCLLLYLDYFLLYMYIDKVLTESFFRVKNPHWCVKIESDIKRMPCVLNIRKKYMCNVRYQSHTVLLIDNN